MGTPIDGSPCGNLCDICWGSGKAFGGGCTPKYITITLSGIVKTPTWTPSDGQEVNGDVELYQDAALPCWYRSYQNGYRFRVMFLSTGTFVRAWTDSDILFFRSDELKCKLIGNSNLNPSYASFYDGDVVIFLGLK